jgi:hypothetical protein
MSDFDEEMLFDPDLPEHSGSFTPVPDNVENESILLRLLPPRIKAELQSVNVPPSGPCDTAKRVEPKSLAKKIRNKPALTVVERGQLGHPPGRRDRSVSTSDNKRANSYLFPFLFISLFHNLANTCCVRPWLLARIEQVFERQLDSLLANDGHLSITLRSRNQQNRLPPSGHSQEQDVFIRSRTFQFPGRSEQEAWRYSQRIWSCNFHPFVH